jgi:phage terminase large subunit
MLKKRLSIYQLIGKGYTRGWYKNCHCRYRAFKGARNTKKSYVMDGLEVISKIISSPYRNVLMIRETCNSHRFSTFATLQMLINMPNPMNPDVSLNQYFKINQSDMTITYRPTGQVILFRGFDDPQKLTSIRVPVGFLTDVYFEEAFEIDDYELFRKLDGSIRGKLPDGLFHQITFTFNAWNQGHWLYEKLFKGRLEDDFEYLMTHRYQDYCNPDEIIEGGYGRGVYLHTSTYKINEFRDTEIYDAVMDELKLKAPEIFKVEGLGMWGNTTEATYPEINDSLLRPQQEINKMRYSCYAIGIDTGLSNGEGKVKTGKDVKVRSATTMQLVGLTADYEKLCCINEFFYSNERELVKKTEPQLMEDIIKTIKQWKELYAMHPDLMKGTILVYVDCADIGFRQGLELEARKQELWNVMFLPSTKIRIQSRVDFIRLIMAFGEFLISDVCKDLYRELKHSVKGQNGKCREDIDDHAINANEYAWAPIINRLKRWKQFKEH